MFPTVPRLQCFVVAAVIAAVPTFAQDETPPWSAKAELSLVATGGNAETTSFGFAGEVVRTYEKSVLRFTISSLRAESTVTERRAVGRPGDFQLIETSETDLTAENYEAAFRGERSLPSDRAWYNEITWRQDEFAGFDARLTFGSGVAFPFGVTERSSWRFESGLTWNREEDLDGEVDEFGGVRLALEGERELTENSTFESKLGVDQNIEDSDDLRAAFYAGLKVAMNDSVALKVSLDLRYDNLPALTTLALEDAEGGLTGESVRVEVDDLDTELKASLVYEF